MHATKQDRFIDYEELRTYVPYSYQQLTRKEKDGEFPARIPLSTNKVVWSFNEIQAWMLEKKEGRPTNNRPSDFKVYDDEK